MHKIGIVSNDRFINKIEEDLNLKAILIQEGMEVDIISWEDENIDYSIYDCLILRSVWGYHNNYLKFKKWLDWIEESNILIFNSISTIKNNIRKDLQFEILDKYGIEHIPTEFQKGYIDLSNYAGDYVIKPIISGSGYKTYKLEDFKEEEFNSIIEEEDNGIMIQPFMKEISAGEYAIIFIDGKNTHNMMRYPGIFSKKEKTFYINEVPEKVMDLAIKVKSIFEDADVLYMRVDIIDKDNPKVMEVELAEPDLLTRNLDFNEPLKVLSKAIRRRLK